MFVSRQLSLDATQILSGFLFEIGQTQLLCRDRVVTSLLSQLLTPALPFPLFEGIPNRAPFILSRRRGPRQIQIGGGSGAFSLASINLPHFVIRVKVARHQPQHLLQKRNRLVITTLFDLQEGESLENLIDERI